MDALSDLLLWTSQMEVQLDLRNRTATDAPKSHSFLPRTSDPDSGTFHTIHKILVHIHHYFYNDPRVSTYLQSLELLHSEDVRRLDPLYVSATLEDKLTSSPSSAICSWSSSREILASSITRVIWSILIP